MSINYVHTAEYIVHLLGDGTLDNYYLTEKETYEHPGTEEVISVEYQLQATFDEANPRIIDKQISLVDALFTKTVAEGKNAEDARIDEIDECEWEYVPRGHGDYEVVSHAYAGFTTGAVLEGGNVGEVYGVQPDWKLISNDQENEYQADYLIDKDIEINSDPVILRAFPLKSLEREIVNHPNNTHYVVLSAGKDDFSKLGNFDRMLMEIPNIQKQYLRIVDALQRMGEERDVRPILVLQYPTDENFRGLMEEFYSPILERAKNDEIRILDLPNTFDPFNGNLYLGGEPSQEGGALIAQGLNHIIKNYYHTTRNVSQLYFRTEDGWYDSRINPGSHGWKVHYSSRK